LSHIITLLVPDRPSVSSTVRFLNCGGMLPFLSARWYVVFDFILTFLFPTALPVKWLVPVSLFLSSFFFSSFLQRVTDFWLGAAFPLTSFDLVRCLVPSLPIPAVADTPSIIKRLTSD
jgi:hypothetical protein